MTIKNSIIENYIKAIDPVKDIIKRFANKKNYLESVLVDISENLYVDDLNLDLILEIDRALIIGHPNESLFLLFIEHAILYYLKFYQIEKAQSICAIANSLSIKNIEPTVITSYKQSSAAIYRYSSRTKAYLELMEDSLKEKDEKSPRCCYLYQNYLLAVANMGMLKENGELKQNPYSWPSEKEKDLYTTESFLLNATRIGDIENGLNAVAQYKSKYGKKLPRKLEDYDDRLRLISGDFNPDHYELAYFKCMAKSYNYFSTNRYTEAISELHNFNIEAIKSHNMKYYTNYLEIHRELCNQKSGNANLMIQEKTQRGDLLYIDDLFLGRIHLIEGNLIEANIVFNRLSENVKRYGAENRIKFELNFAKELPITNILQLINGWQNISNNKSMKPIASKKSLSTITSKGIDLIIGNNQAILNTKDSIKKYAKINAPILISGETGTGKELVARALHEESANANEPFIAINCGALTDTLLQSELFGYEAGTFTGAQKKKKGIFISAGKGTVFLDEFGDISAKLQISLLRVLESNEIRSIGGEENLFIQCKIVVASNVDLQNRVAEKRFREDLYFRLSRFEIHLPPLRDRKDDIPTLIQHFLNKNAVLDNNSKKLTDELINILSIYHWPGNIRELKNEIDRLLILKTEKEVLGVEDFDFNRLKNFTYPGKNSIKETNNSDSVQKIIESGFKLEQRHNQIIDIFNKYKRVTRKQLIEITKACPATISNDLKSLLESKIIIKRTPSKSPRSHFFEINNHK